MRATQDQIETLANALAPHADEIRRYASESGFTPKRVRWDAFWAIARPVREAFANAMYASGGNDDHIDTALRRVMVRIGIQEVAR